MTNAVLAGLDAMTSGRYLRQVQRRYGVLLAIIRKRKHVSGFHVCALRALPLLPHALDKSLGRGHALCYSNGLHAVMVVCGGGCVVVNCSTVLYQFVLLDSLWGVL